jgi:hypothetical protein
MARVITLHHCQHPPGQWRMPHSSSSAHNARDSTHPYRRPNDSSSNRMRRLLTEATYIHSQPVPSTSDISTSTSSPPTSSNHLALSDVNKFQAASEKIRGVVVSGINSDFIGSLNES